MRRSRDVRDHRDALRRKSMAERVERRKQQAAARMQASKEKANKRVIDRIKRDQSNKSVQPMEGIHFERHENYICVIEKPIQICHIIESLGMGGGQTMMMELVGGLKKYYGDKVIQTIVCPRPSFNKYDKNLYASYGVNPVTMREKELARFLSRNNVQIVLQHRLAVSRCIKSLLTSSAKYILMNHTYHQLNRLSNFIKCDYYVSVCNYLDKEARWPSYIHPNRRGVILNGVENDYLSNIEPAKLEGSFKTGRCHRLVQSKFKTDSLIWMETIVAKTLPGHHHYLLGHHQQARKMLKKSKTCHYIGPVSGRQKKMSYLKALDMYYYETFAHEGASVAILESLACGVPVLCRDYGGNRELIQEGVNGFIVNERNDFLARMEQFARSPEQLAELKQSTLDDFNRRLHVKHTAAKYMQLFEAILKQ